MVEKHLRSIISWMLVIVIGSSICNIPVLADDANESYLQGVFRMIYKLYWTTPLIGLNRNEPMTEVLGIMQR